LCDRIFGEENFVINAIWNSRKSVSSDAIVSLNHNYTTIYAKNINKLRGQIKKDNKFKLLIREDKFSNPDNDSRGPWTADPFDAPEIRSNLAYEITNPYNNKTYLPPHGRHWRTTKEEYEKFLKEGRIIFGKTGNSKPQLKRYLSDAEIKGITPKSIWDDVGTTTNGTQELEEIFGEKIFNNPKPVSLIRRILELATGKNSTVLDFMAGSGTTGHAVLDLNREDGGNRRFILCTNNELNGLAKELKERGMSDKEIEEHGICRRVTYPRLEKVINGYKNPKSEQVEGLRKFAIFQNGFCQKGEK
jgi:adenine-specific DNA-methyltransferase